MQIIPAIDIIEGKCVRLTQGDYSQKKIYNEHPLEVARQFEDAGLKRLHLVDLDGAKEGRVRNWKVLEAIAGKTSMIIDFGGGIKAENDLQIPFVSTADWGYLRLRRPDYGDRELEDWLKRVKGEGWRDVFVFFKHEDEAKGPLMAKRFLELAG